MRRTSAQREAGAETSDDAVGRPSWLLDRWAAADVHALILSDGSGREAWSGRPARILTRGAAADAVRQLSGTLAGLRLPAGAVVAIALPNGSEACLAVLAVEQAGLLPCLVPLGLDEQHLGPILETCDARAVVTQARVGDLRPAAMFCSLAASRFRLRFVLAFGPDVPDGVVDLDSVGRGPAPPEPTAGRPLETGLATCEAHGNGHRVLVRPWTSLLAAATLVLDACRYREGDIVLACLAPDDLTGLCTGWLGCLLSGATLMCPGSLQPVGRTFDPPAPATGSRHIVVPGWAERLLRETGALTATDALVLVHRSPGLLPGPDAAAAPGPLPHRTADVLALGEQALVAAMRDGRGRCTVVLDGDHGPVGRPILGLRQTPDGLELRGIAASTAEFQVNWADMLPNSFRWRPYFETALPSGPLSP